MILVGARARYSGQCGCRTCWSERRALVEHDLPAREKISRPFIVCDTCGNKRCPHATDHRLPCTGSNKPGQPGSDYQ